jgi:hypothetical protein
MSNAPVTKTYKADFKEAINDLCHMTEERERLETKIAKQKKRVAALHELMQIEESSAAILGLVEGISDACRVVLRAAEKPLHPTEIRDRIQALGFPSQSNLLASVHTTVRRMKESGEVAENMLPLDSGGTGAFYVWQGEARKGALQQLASLYKGKQAKPITKAPRPPHQVSGR